VLPAAARLLMGLRLSPGGAAKAREEATATSAP
jgi:hypothetical protein